MSKYDKAFEIYVSNMTPNNTANFNANGKTLYTFNFSKPLIFPPMATYQVSHISATTGSNNGVGFVFNIQEFSNNVYVGNEDGGKMNNGILYMTTRFNTNGLEIDQEHNIYHLCNSEPLVLSSLTLKVTDLAGQPRFLTVDGTSGGNQIGIGINISIRQDPLYVQKNIQKRNQELMVGLMAQKKEYNPLVTENI